MTLEPMVHHLIEIAEQGPESAAKVAHRALVVAAACHIRYDLAAADFLTYAFSAYVEAKDMDHRTVPA